MNFTILKVFSQACHIAINLGVTGYFIINFLGNDERKMEKRMSFLDLGIDEKIVAGLEKQNVAVPTDIQKMAIPPQMDGKDVIIHSQTGSGKTLAYLLPIFERQIKTAQKGALAIIIVPTQELAMQVYTQATELASNSGVTCTSTVVFGNVNIKRQEEKLKQKPNIIIGTYGRIMELIKKKSIGAHTVKTIVVDEADKLLDVQNIDGIKQVRKAVMRDTQVVLASASITQKTQDAAAEITSLPVIVATKEKMPADISHMVIYAEHRDKAEVLRKLIGILEPKRAMIFINKLEEIEHITEKLQFHKLSAACIHGDNAKQDRKTLLTDFKSGNLKLLVSSDIAARGLHIEDVDVVFSVSIPQDGLDYLHRAGRTGRGGKHGVSILIASPKESAQIERFERRFEIEIKKVIMENGKLNEPWVKI